MTADRRPARGFPPFPRRRPGRGRTWWARAFVAAVEDTAIDQGLLRAARALAGSGRIGPITVSPGRVSAPVDDPVDDVTYHPVLRISELSGADRDRLAEQVRAEAGYLAALLDGEVPHGLASAARAAGVGLVPAVGELESDCDCPEWGDPCRHGAAVAYQVAWLLDTDPTVLLLLRGRDAAGLVADLTAGPREPGSPATEAVEPPAPTAQQSDTAAPPGPGGLPEPPPVPASWPPVEPLVVPPAPGVDPDELARLAVRAAARARDLLAGAGAGAVPNLAGHEDGSADHPA